MGKFKVLFLALISIFFSATVNAEVSTDSINGDDASVTFVKLNADTYRAVLTKTSKTTKPFDIQVKAWEWARSIMTFKSSAINANDSVQVTVEVGGNEYNFWSRNIGWLRVLPGQKVVLTEIFSDQGESTKKYLAYTALKDEQVANYAAYAPAKKPVVNRRSNASAPQQPAADKKVKGKKKGKRLTDSEVLDELAAGSGDYYIEAEGNPRIK